MRAAGGSGLPAIEVAADPTADMVTLDARAARLDAYLDATGYDAVWFARPNAFAWLTGASNVVDRGAAIGVAAAGYVRDGDDGSVQVVAAEPHAGRLRTELLPESVAVSEAPWHESLGDAVADRSPTHAAADFDAPGLDELDAASLRQPLDDNDIDRYRQLCEETAAAVERVCRELSPDDTDHEVASALRITLSSGDIEAPVVLVSGSERAQKYGAAPAAGERLGDYAVVSVTSQRGGLHASLTRTVAFDAPDWLHERHRAAARVEASALAATRAVASEDGVAGDVFEEIQDAYAAVDHPEAWREGEQGGAAGFARREWLATPDGTEPVTTPMGYAWNPTVAGARSEDTYLVETDDGAEAPGDAAGFECLTATPNWPTIEVEAADRDVTLERHGILEK